MIQYRKCVKCGNTHNQKMKCKYYSESFEVVCLKCGGQCINVYTVKV